MIPLRMALLVSAAACWDAWRLLVGRIDDPATGALLAAAAAWVGWRGWRLDGQVRAGPVAAALTLYAVACLTGPALVQIGVASALVACLAVTGLGVPRLPLVGLAMLLLPVLPTLDFLLAWPLRRASALSAVALLRMNGVGVTLDGIALDWQGRQLLFDGPCSGVRMLWASLVLASLVALARGFGPFGYARGLLLAVGIAVVGNGLRAASLFYLENGAVTGLSGGLTHEAVGLLAFAMVAIAVLAATHRARAA